MPAPSDYGFELDGVPFGIRQDITVENEGFDPGTDEWETQDATDPRSGVTWFGRDKLAGPTWAWTLSTNMLSVEEALAARAKLHTAWRAAHIRDTPGALTSIRYTIAGRTRRVFGRPQRWASPPSNRIMSGYVPITCDFKCVDPLHYADVQRSVKIDIAPESAGGFVLPARLPIVSLPSGTREGVIEVFGDAKTYPVIRIDGPVNKPWVEGLDWRLDFDTNLLEGQHLIVDAHPWKYTVLRNGGVNLSGTLGRRQWLPQVRLTPGVQEIKFGGSSSTNAAKCTVSWRDAYNDL